MLLLLLGLLWCILFGCIRRIAKPVVKKEPITSDILKKFYHTFVSESDCSLGYLRGVTIFFLFYAGFLG